MGRPKGSKNNSNIDVLEESTPEVSLDTIEMSSEDSQKTLAENIKQAESNKAILDATNTDKAKKDVLLMNIKELESHVLFLRQRLVELDTEYIGRRKLVDGINGSIAGAQAELTSIRSTVAKQNVLALAEIEKSRKELESADKTLRRLMVENEALIVSNKQRESILIERERIANSQVYEMKKALDQNQSEWNKREIDILEREKSLQEERIKLEEEKTALAPEASRISAIKNENILLLQEIEREKANNRNVMLGIESEKQVLKESQILQESKVKTLEQSLANQEKRLREWEQNLKDYDLEIRAKSAKAEKLLRQMQLEKEANSK